MAKNFNDINSNFINNSDLLKLNLQILILDYLEKKTFCFIKVVIKDKNKKNENIKELKIFNSKKEKNIQRILWKDKRNT